MAIEANPAFLQAQAYSAEVTRRAVFAAFARTSANSPGIISGGLISTADCQIAAPVSGMSVNVGTGEAIVGGTEGAVQGGYYARIASTTNLTISAASPSHPRVDIVCVTIADAGYTEPSGGSGSQGVPQIVTGTPTAAASLANLLGVGSLPASSLLLGYVLVPTSATSIITADIKNAAGLASLGLPAFDVIDINSNTTAVSGQSLVSSVGGITVTLPVPSANAVVKVTASGGGSMTGASPVTIATNGGTVFGTGLSGAAPLLGTPGATITVRSDGANWFIDAGEGDTGWIAVAGGVGFQNSWVNVGLGTAPAAYRKQGDTVQIRGSVKSGGSAVIFTLPAGFLPIVGGPSFVVSFGGTPGVVSVVSGNVQTTGLPSATTLDDIDFSVS